MILKPEHQRARYEGDGDPGCYSTCARCFMDQLVEAVDIELKQREWIERLIKEYKK